MKAYAMIPTYNEADNIESLLKELMKIPGMHAVVVDDNSPDGTAQIVKKLGRKNKRIELLLRTKDKGRGSAGIAGFRYCIKKNADYIIEMDADFSHHPKFIPPLLNALKKYEVVLGSRQVKGGKQVGRPLRRRLLTYFANFYIRTVLGIRVMDCNSGFRGFRKSALEKILKKPMESKGPDVVQEVLYRAHLLGLKIHEVPITFYEREHGASKLGLKHLWRGYTAVLRLRWQHILGKI